MNNKTIQDILIIGDKGESVTSVIKILDNLGHHVEGRTSLTNTEKYILKKPPSLIFLIVHEKHTQYCTLLKSFQSDLQIQKIPVVVISLEKEKLEKQYKTFKIKKYLHLPINSSAITSSCHLLLKSQKGLNYIFNDTRRLKATFKGDLIRINEISALLKSPVKFSSNQELNLKSNYLKEKLLFDIFRSKIFEESKYSQSKTYLTELIILGLKEENTKSIRAISKV